MEKRHSISLKNHKGHATFTGEPTQELIDAVNRMADLAYEKVNEGEKSDDELWNELGKYIHGGESFTWYPHTLRYLKENYSLQSLKNKQP